MTKILALTAITLVMASTVHSETRIDKLCEPAHQNELAGLQDVTANPGGYYIASLRTQLSHGDPRIVMATGDVFHLCTRSAATPDMDTGRARSLMKTREVKYLFVPITLNLSGTQS